MRDKKYAHERPAGPAPTTATLRLAFTALSRTSGSWILSSCSTKWRLRNRIDTASSRPERRHLVSQGWKHTREQTWASGCARGEAAGLRRNALRRSTKRIQARLRRMGRRCCRARVRVHDTRQQGSACRGCGRHIHAGNVELWTRPGLAPLAQAAQRRLFDDLAQFFSFSMSPSSPLPSQMRVTTSSMRLVPTRHGGHFPHDSSCTNSRKNRATSTIQLSSSITIRPPIP